MSVLIENRKVITKVQIKRKLNPDLSRSFFNGRFPKTEKVLLEDDFLDNYFIWVCKNKFQILKWYDSIMDFLYCELFSQHNSKYTLGRKFNTWWVYFLDKHNGIVTEVEDEFSHNVKVLCFKKKPFEYYDDVMSKGALPLLKGYIDRCGKGIIAWTSFKNTVDLAMRMKEQGLEVTHNQLYHSLG